MTHLLLGTGQNEHGIIKQFAGHINRDNLWCKTENHTLPKGYINWGGYFFCHIYRSLLCIVMDGKVLKNAQRQDLGMDIRISYYPDCRIFGYWYFSYKNSILFQRIIWIYPVFIRLLNKLDLFDVRILIS